MASHGDPARSAGLTRRALVSALPLGLAACAGAPKVPGLGGLFDDGSGFDYSQEYARTTDNGRTIPAVNLDQIDPVILRRRVADPTGEAPGTIVVEPHQRRLYFVEGGGRAIRYGVGVGREGMEWSGRATVARKAVWPTWTPTPAMIRRDPKLNGPWAGGMPGGVNNPLGARALYLYQGGRDSSYRIHGTNAPRSIGRAMSSGCIRMLNHDVIDLYERVKVGAKVIIKA